MKGQLTDREPVTIRRVKVAWIRNAVPPGAPAPGHLHCPCGHAPESVFDESQPDIVCACGRVYDWAGYIVRDI